MTNQTLTVTRAEAAASAGVSVTTFDSWVRQGIVPGPIRGTRRWSRAALERALSGIASPEMDPYDKWKTEHPFEAWKAERSLSPVQRRQAERVRGSMAPVTPLPVAALGKREKSVLRQLYARRDAPTRDADLNDAGPATIQKVGARGYLVPQGNGYYHLTLTTAGLRAAEELAGEASR